VHVACSDVQRHRPRRYDEICIKKKVRRDISRTIFFFIAVFCHRASGSRVVRARIRISEQKKTTSGNPFRSINVYSVPECRRYPKLKVTALTSENYLYIYFKV
jgi:hypothetical protein